MECMIRVCLGVAFLVVLHLGFRMWRRQAGRGNLMKPRHYTAVRTMLVALLAPFVLWYVWTPETVPFALSRELPSGIRAIGLMMFIIGFIVRVWAQVTLGHHWSADLSVRDGHEIVRHGPYAWSAHPMYDAYVLIAPGLLLSTQNWAIGLIAIAYVIVSRLRIPQEERMLTVELGQVYVRYFESVRRRRVEAAVCTAVSVFIAVHMFGMGWELLSIIG